MPLKPFPSLKSSIYHAPAIARFPSLAWFSQQQPVFRCDLERNHLSEDGVTGRAQSGDTGGIDGERTVHPPLQAAKVGGIKVMTAGEDRHPGTGRNSTVKNQIGQGTAGMRRNHDIIGGQRCLLDTLLDKRCLSPEPRPGWLRFVADEDRPQGRLGTCYRAAA